MDGGPPLGIVHYGTLHFLNVHTRQDCQPPFDIGRNWQGPSFVWLADGRIFTVIPPEEERAGQVLVGPPCGPEFTDIANRFPAPVLSIAAAKPDSSLLLLDTGEGYLLYEPETAEMRFVDESVHDTYTGFSWSPNGTRLGVSTFVSYESPRGITWLVSVETGEVEEEIPWEESALGIGGPSGPLWLNEDQFIILMVYGDETLLVTMGQSVISLADFVERLTDKECITESIPQSCSIGPVTVAMLKGTDNYHLILDYVFIEDENIGALLYHSESDEAEQLSFNGNAGISPDGTLLFLEICPLQPCELWELWVRQVDPLGSTSSPLLSANSEFSPVFSRDGKKMAISVELREQDFTKSGIIYIFSLPDAQPIGIWNIGPYTGLYSYYGWSPGGDRFAFPGYLPEGQGWGLFVIEVP